MQRRRRERISVAQTFLSVSLILALWLVPAASQAADVSAADLQLRAKDVEAMSTIDRSRLERNWDAFLKMTPERQQHFRQLHENLQEDLKSGGNKLNHTMQTYSQWLQTLTPGQREDLRQATNPAQKLSLVKKFKEEQDLRLEGRGGREDQPRDPRRFLRYFFRTNPLAKAELEAALEGLVNVLPAAERNQIASLDSAQHWARYRRIIESSARQAGERNEWPNKEQQSAVLEAIKATDQAQQIDIIKDDRTRRHRVGMLLFGSFAAQMFAESATFQPKEGDLLKMLEQLDNATREKLLQMNVHEMNQALWGRYVRKQFEERADVRELSQTHFDFQEFTRQFMIDSELGGGRFRRLGGGPPGPGRPLRDGNAPRPEPRTK